jgi:hypothetical protein
MSAITAERGDLPYPEACIISHASVYLFAFHCTRCISTPTFERCYEPVGGHRAPINVVWMQLLKGGCPAEVAQPRG